MTVADIDVQISDRPQEPSMNDTASGGAQASIGAAARSVAGGLQEAASRAQHAASRTQGGVTEIREVIRAQPITAALLVFTLGYLFGRLGSLIPSGSQR
jgi:hypothetical protein